MGRPRLTTYDYIMRARNVHGDKYSYSKTFYFGAKGTVTLQCNICDYIFDQRADHHLQGSGCTKCYKKYSQVSIDFFNEYSKYITTIQHAENGGEYKIPGTRYNVDGYYDKDGMEYVIEFHGSYWHSDPRVTDHNDIKHRNNYEKTMNRMLYIKSLGYEVGYILNLIGNVIYKIKSIV